MATTYIGGAHANRAVAVLHRFDPGGAYWRYALYASLVAALGATGGYVLTLTLTGSTSSYLGAVYAGILSCLSMLFLKPTPARYPAKEIAAAWAAILIGAGLGGAFGHNPNVAEPLTVLIAAAGFFVRRWPEPLSMAGFVGILSYIISQILAPVTTSGVIHSSMLALIFAVTVGFWFVPRRVFTRALLVTVQRMRAGLASELSIRADDPDAVRASVGRVDALLRRINEARVLADQYDPANARQHLALIHWAATAARSWENAADTLVLVHASAYPQDIAAKAACAVAKAAVAEALATRDEAKRRAAEAALSKINDVVDALASDPDFKQRGPDQSGAALFHVLGSELALSHLLDAVWNLDSELAKQSGSA